MKTRQTLIAASIAALLVSGNAFAKEQHELHEHLWNQIKSYGQVMLGEDSVDNWGPWADFVEPAAGAPSPVQLPGSGGSDPYKKIPDVLTQGCAAGNWCGYAIFRDKSRESGGDYPSIYGSEGMKNKTPVNAGLFSLTLAPDSNITAGSGRGDGTVFWRLTSIDKQVIPNFTDSGAAIPVYFGGKKDDGLHHFQTTYPQTAPLIYSDTSETAYVSGISHNPRSNEASKELAGNSRNKAFEKAIAASSASNDEVAVGKFMRQILTYTSGGEIAAFSEGGYTSSKETEGYYVVGIATPLAYLASQSVRGAEANYSGGSYDGKNQGTVYITVQFKTGEWNGNWSWKDSNGINFRANGVIDGSDIKSSSISSKAGIVDPTSYVKGTFYGQTAGSIGGVSSVTVTAMPSVETLARMPSQPQMQTQTQTQTAIFLVNKDIRK